MKIKILILTIAILIFGLIYFVADSKLFYYGKSTHNILKKSLPLELQPDYLGSRVSYPIIGFTIRDKYGQIKIGKDTSINIDSMVITIKEVIKYGFNDKVLVANVLTENDETCNIRLIYYSESKLNYELLTSQEVSNLDNLKWIVLNEDSGIKSIRSNTVLLFIVFLVLFFVGGFIIKKSKTIRNNN